MRAMLDIIEEITSSLEYKPSEKGIIRVVETPDKCYKIVEEYDTTKQVERDSLEKFQIDTEHYKQMINTDKHNMSISNYSDSEVWNNTIINQILQELNDKRESFIIMYNNSIENILLLSYGVDKMLPRDFIIARNIYNLRLKESHKELEIIVELLMRMLNFCGYWAEKSERTAVSSTHDVSHCIYATSADYIISMDERFSKKCKAIYTYLGVPTKVIYCKDDADVLSWIRDYNREEVSL